jgi:putative copper resistance protein D
MTAWLVAAAVIAGLIVAVVHYLGENAGHGAMQMQMGSADALTRAGGATPSQPLWGSALFTSWQLDAIAVAAVVLAATLYLTGVALVPVRSPGERWPASRTAFFLAGLAVCIIATNGSIAVYDQVLFSAHMLGHLALVMVAPALIMGGRPLRLILASSPPQRRARLARVFTGPVMSLLTSPPVALATYAAVIVGSHLTGLMDVIMRDTWAGQVEHLVYLLAGCQFFALIVGDEAIRWRLSSPARWLLLAIAMAVDTFTGIVLMQGTVAVHVVRSALHVNTLTDTHTGGAIMWFGGDAIMAVIMIALVLSWLNRPEVRTSDERRGWMEAARRATFAEHTGAAVAPTGPGADGTDFDEDEAARAAYNEWLARLNRSS